jgi:hypothetical protein
MLRILQFVPVAELIIVMVIAMTIFGPRELMRVRFWRRG